jgi:hypothetical protein
VPLTRNAVPLAAAALTWIFVVACVTAVFVAYGESVLLGCNPHCLLPKAGICRSLLSVHGLTTGVGASSCRAGIGANDLANSFGSSVGAGALSSECRRAAAQRCSAAASAQRLRLMVRVVRSLI